MCNDASLLSHRLALINFRSRCLLILKRYFIAVTSIFTVSRVIQGNVTHVTINPLPVASFTDRSRHTCSLIAYKYTPRHLCAIHTLHSCGNVLACRRLSLEFTRRYTAVDSLVMTLYSCEKIFKDRKTDSVDDVFALSEFLPVKFHSSDLSLRRSEFFHSESSCEYFLSKFKSEFDVLHRHRDRFTPIDSNVHSCMWLKNTFQI